MTLIEVVQPNVRVDLTEDDLYILKQALNEVCNGLALFEFSTRMGAEKGEVLELMWCIGDIIDTYKSSRSDL